MSSSSDYLNTFTQNASRLGMRLQETFAEHTRELALNRNSALDLSDDKTKNIPKQLDSSSDREKLDAMRRLIALISKGRNVSEYFAQVVKNVASHNLEIRKFVYIYLLRYAEQEPDLALLSINTFQKDLNDPNPFIRAMALRVLSGIKVPMIANIVLLAVKKCAADISPYVRKVAASAIPECYVLDTSLQPSLIEIITNLLRDRSPLSIGNVVVAFESVCPTRLDLIHQQYRRLCRLLVDVDEWGQVDVLNLLLRYARTMLPRPNQTDELDKDIQILLTSSEPLLMSRNASVVMTASRVIYYTGQPAHHHKIVQPLLRLLHTSPEIERVGLTYILIISRSSPSLFSGHYSRFLLRSDDLKVTKQTKLKILLSITNNENRQAILRELIEYADDADDEIVAAAIQGIGRCALLFADTRQQCLSALVGMIRSTIDAVVSNSVLVLKSLIQIQLSVPADVAAGPSSPLSIIAQLARRIDDIHHPDARACVLWLVGQYAASPETKDGIAEWAPDVLRKVAKSFHRESQVVKLQGLTLSAKLLVLSPSTHILRLLNTYVLSLARYDVNYDVRDRARMLSALSVGVIGGQEAEDRPGVVLRTEQVKLVLFEGKKPVQDIETVLPDEPTPKLGSMQSITGKPMHISGTTILPDWLEQGVEPSLRQTPEDEKPEQPSAPVALASLSSTQSRRNTPITLTPVDSPTGSVAATKATWNDLDKFYESSSEDEESEEEQEEGDEDDADEDEEASGDEDETAVNEESEGEEEEEHGASTKDNTGGQIQHR